jgi:hypothetical protein
MSLRREFRRGPLLVAAALLFGCAASRTIIDRINAEPLSDQAFHRQLTAKEQCMHCHSELANAPAVPHPEYKKCVSCHSVATDD